MKNRYLILAALIFALSIVTFGQRPGGGPPGGMGRPETGGPPRGDMQRPGDGQQRPDWAKAFDADRNGSIDNVEFKAAVDATFAEMDRNGNGVIDGDEIGPPRPEGPRPPDGEKAADEPRPSAGRGDMPPRPILPPFFFKDRVQPGQSFTKAQFEEIVRGTFNEMDRNKDGVLSREESRPPRRDGQPGGPPQGPPQGRGPQMPPNARFIGAEMRFGDKLVTGQPFSAETVIEDNRRLYDGTAVSKQVKGAIYRDGSGRTRREQPLENVGGFNVVGDNSKPQMLVFINDFAAKTQYFLDLNNKIARKDHMGDNKPPRPENDGPPEAKTESLGTKTIDGISVEGTRTTFEIPAGQLGNAKPIQVVSEKWFSPELQVVVMSRHLDPLAGEHIFKLVNIKRGEPSADLFAVPAEFTLEAKPGRRPEE
jgi:hypothetical protein